MVIKLEVIQLNMTLSYYFIIFLLNKMKSAPKGSLILNIDRFVRHQKPQDFVRNDKASLTKNDVDSVLTNNPPTTK